MTNKKINNALFWLLMAAIVASIFINNQKRTNMEKMYMVVELPQETGYQGWTSSPQYFDFYDDAFEALNEMAADLGLAPLPRQPKGQPPLRIAGRHNAVELWVVNRQAIH